MSNASGIEQRFDLRQDVGNLIVQLEARPGAGPVDCLVVDWSERGARLVVPSDIELARIVYVVVSDTRVAAWVAWRKQAQIGIEFLGAAPRWTELSEQARVVPGPAV